MVENKNLNKHPFHIVSPSPWPLLLALATLVLLLGTILFMHKDMWWLMITGLLSFFTFMFLWFQDITHESLTPAHTENVRQGFRYGIVLFIISEIMFFVSFFWAYFDASLDPKQVIGNVWPPENIKVIDPFSLPYFNTLLLLLSGTTITWAHHSLIHQRYKDTIKKLSYTIALGILFLAVQAYEYYHATFAFDDGIYPSTFYMATGFHGFHVLVGIIFLSVSLWRTYKKHFSPTDHFCFEAATWYWHFVDVVWLFLFVTIYWGSA